MDASTMQQYMADNPPTVVPLAIKPHFEALSLQEKLYAHYVSIACFSGTRVTLRQCSPESEDIYDLIIGLYIHCKGDWKALQQEASLSDGELQDFLNYSAQFLGNAGNYKSFGDAKFVPRLAEPKFEALASVSERTWKHYRNTRGAIYPQDAARMHFGYPDAGHVSTYYPDSPSITKDEITQVSEFLDNKGLLPENTRLRKDRSGNFEVLVASSQKVPAPDNRDVTETEYALEGALTGSKVYLTYGDHAVEMAKAAEACRNASKYAANGTEKSMMAEYAKSFDTGSYEAMKQSQRHWIKDKGPVVETNIGFVETYRDPHGVRGEWEGFAAMVNKERTRAFGKLVDAAPRLIPDLPWDAAFEKDKFLSPDFTSLEVLTFAGSGIPAGINIPNMNDIRQEEGFKNVSLGNVLGAKANNEPIPFISDADLEVYKKYRDLAFEVQVGLHELLGHGCGKLLQETSPGVFNFDVARPPLNPCTNKPVDKWYKPGQTWGSVFSAIGSSYEECRAECVAMLLCCDFGVLSIFGAGDGTEDMDGVAGDVLYTAYLSMARAGIAALEFWDPKSRKWGQIHMQARYSILKTFLSAGPSFCKLSYTDPDLSDLTISLDRAQITTLGRAAVRDYLQKLGVYKATADVEAGSALYSDMTHVDEWWGTKVRDEVLRRKTPRKVFVQANTVLEGEAPVLKEYAATPEGMIQSYAERTYI